MPYAVDFHTHSTASPDGSLTPEDYRLILLQDRLHYIAITDHNTVAMAHRLQQSLGELGSRIIVGEEITTTEGELIGLYLTDKVAPNLTPEETVAEIKRQGGLVYVPHPFETVRKGVSAITLDRIAADVDIIEIHNGRAVFQNRSKQAMEWASVHDVPGAAGSDAHGSIGWGRTCTIIGQVPTRHNLPGLLRNSELRRGFVGIRGIMYPKFNRFRKRFIRDK